MKILRLAFTVALFVAFLLFDSSGCRALDSGGADKPYDLRFAVISDTHIGATGRGADVYSVTRRLINVLKWYNTQEDVKTVVITGDLTEGGTEIQYDAYSFSVYQYKGDLRVISVMGNHDAFPDDQTKGTFFENYTKNKTNAHYVIDGYHLIVVNAGSGALTDTGPAGPMPKYKLWQQSKSIGNLRRFAGGAWCFMKSKVTYLEKRSRAFARENSIKCF